MLGRPHVVVGAVLVRDSRVLLAQRCARRSWYPGYWDVPGGHVAAGELPALALARELSEELGIFLDDAALPPSPDVEVIVPEYHLSLWLIRAWAGEPYNAAPAEHDRIEWFELPALAGLAVSPGLLPLLRTALEGS